MTKNSPWFTVKHSLFRQCFTYSNFNVAHLLCRKQITLALLILKLPRQGSMFRNNLSLYCWKRNIFCIVILGVPFYTFLTCWQWTNGTLGTQTIRNSKRNSTCLYQNITYTVLSRGYNEVIESCKSFASKIIIHSNKMFRIIIQH